MLSKILKHGRFLPIALILCFASVAHGEPERVQRGNLVLENFPEIPAGVTRRLEQCNNTRSAGLASWLHDGSILVARS